MTSYNPNIRADYSPLETLAISALRQYGEFHPSTIDADLALLFIECGNEVIGDWNTHPYLSAGNLPRVEYYVSQTEARDIPDQVMAAGLLAYYSMQQASPKGQLYMPRYNRLLNRTMWDIISGSGPIRLRPVDGGTNAAHSPATSKITGMPNGV